MIPLAILYTALGFSAACFLFAWLLGRAEGGKVPFK